MPVSTTATAQTAGLALSEALAEYGVTAHRDGDAGDSWLLVNTDASNTHPGVGMPQLVAFVYDFLSGDSLSVDAPAEHYAGRWRVSYSSGTREDVVFYGKASGPAGTAECAAFIADRVSGPVAA
ncbi:hypothetical protein [Streptomyces similanensis]|uniref:Uncharacterized protein n=1 Tax=Streptomyces similanensis TaxID=1274988 RepID=A0ABP9L3U6_9ACTN